jgi:hypothetical protein
MLDSIEILHRSKKARAGSKKKKKDTGILFQESCYWNKIRRVKQTCSL